MLASYLEVDIMNKRVLPELEQKINTLCNEIFENLAKNCDANYSELLAMGQEINSIYLERAAASLQQWAEKYAPASIEESGLGDIIEADSITVEIIDKNTGNLFRRNLPIKYLETDNGLILSGETMEGNPSQIAFLSDTALSRINDVVGKGPDTHRCE
jgi:hypothetical protein